jgi:tetratricopeptide (TPR) repeat protein
MRLRTLGALALAACIAGCDAPPDPTSPGDLVSQARRLDLEGEHDAAVTAYRRALERDPESFDAHYGLGRALDLAGSYEEARAQFATAVELAGDGSKDQALRMLGISWVFAGKTSEAASCFAQVFDRRLSTGNFAGASEVANELGRVYLESGDTDQAEVWYRTGHETAGREPDRKPSQIDLADMRWAHARARIAAQDGLTDEARAQVASVRQLLDKGGNQDQEIQYAYLLGYVAFHLGEYEAALAALEQADQSDPFILLLEAEASERLEREDIAREYYEKVLASTSHAVTAAFARPIAGARLENGR